MEIRSIVDDQKPKKYKIGDTDAFLMMITPKPKELAEIRKKCTFKKRGRAGLGSEFNETKFNNECMNKFITGWGGIKLDGKDLEPTLENKIICDNNWTPFNECWNDVVVGAEIEDADESEAEVKNL